MVTSKFISLAITLIGMSVTHADRPNVVLLISDDQGWSDYGFMGHPHLQTPNLDQLARAAMVYERGYVTAPLCRPSLASIVTGMYPHQTSIRGNDPLLPLGVRRTSTHFTSISKSLRDRMTAPMLELPSFVKSLSQNGYATLQTGKWWERNPLEHGFTEAMTHGELSRGGRHGDEGLSIGRTTMKPIFDFIDNAQSNKQPFFIWYGVFLPHTPHDAPPRFFEQYKELAPDESTARYWANIQWLDEGCGQIVEYLKQKGLYNNTMILYTCDNGWVANPNRVGGSIRSKREPVEAGIRTPIFVTHEGKIDPMRDKTTLASNIDVATTILRACDIEPPPTMQGLDLRNPKALQERNRVFVDVYQHDSDLDQLADLDNGLIARVVIDGWDKLIMRPDRKELYDLQNDPDDRTDLSEVEPDKVKTLTKAVQQWITSSGVQ